MRYLRVFTALFFVASLLLSLWVGFRDRNRRNSDIPTLSGPEQTLQISVKDGPNALLQGLQAQDTTDGDLTDQILVSSVSHFLEPGTVNVKYVVFDKHNNSATFTRKVHYTDYEAPRFSLSKAPVYLRGTPFDLLTHVKVQDCLDGDISDRIRVISNTVNNFTSGVYPVVLEVSNSCGDTAQLTVYVTYTDKADTALIQLRSYLVYVTQGSDFDPYAHIASVTDLNHDALDRENITVAGNLDLQTPGQYSLTYHYTDAAHNGQTALTVVVTEEG